MRDEVQHTKRLNAVTGRRIRSEHNTAMCAKLGNHLQI